MTPTEIQRLCDEIVKLGEKATAADDVNSGIPHNAYHRLLGELNFRHRTFAPAAAVALKVAIEGLRKIGWVNGVGIPKHNPDADIARLVLTAIAIAFHE